MKKIYALIISMLFCLSVSSCYSSFDVVGPTDDVYVDATPSVSVILSSGIPYYYNSRILYYDYNGWYYYPYYLDGSLMFHRYRKPFRRHDYYRPHAPKPQYRPGGRRPSGHHGGGYNPPKPFGGKPGGGAVRPNGGSNPKPGNVSPRPSVGQRPSGSYRMPGSTPRGGGRTMPHRR